MLYFAIFWTFCKLYCSVLPIDFWIMFDQPVIAQKHVHSIEIYYCSFQLFLVSIDFYFQRYHLSHLSILYSVCIENFEWEIYWFGLYLFLFDQLFVNFNMYVSGVHQCLDFEVLAILYFHICSHVQFSFYITLSIWNNIFILRIYREDFLYHAYLKSSPKSYSFLLSSSSFDSSWIFLFFINYFPLQFLAIYTSLSHLKHFHVFFSFFF